MPNEFALPENTVWVCVKHLARLSEELHRYDGAWLSREENLRLESMLSNSRRAQFLAGRYLVRNCLSAQLGGSWHTYHLSAPVGGSPRLLDAANGIVIQNIHVSISHSHDWVACAVAPQEVGIDVELSSRRRDFATIKQWMRDIDDSKVINERDESSAQRLFYEQWTLNEAWFKQLGVTQQNNVTKPVAFRTCSETDRRAIVGRAKNLYVAVYSSLASTVRSSDRAFANFSWSSWCINNQ